MSESLIEKNILKEFNREGVRLFKNHVGFGKMQDGSFMHFGLCKGSSDLIGITKITITEDMVGKEIGVFTAIECKAPKGRSSKDQINFIEMVKKLCGFAGVARSNKDVKEIIRKEM